MIKSLIITSFASLITLLPSQGSSKTDPILHSVQTEQASALKMPVPEPQTAIETALHPLSSGLLNLYTWGNCTAYAASRLPVPNNWGNANTWDDNARAMGLSVSSVPKVGAIAESDSDSYLGHVAIVESVSGDSVIISEMNYRGLGVVDTRLALPGEFVYIYF